MEGHAVQLFDTQDSVAERLVVFIRDGLLAGEAVLLVVTAPHWQAILTKCRRAGVDVDVARARSALTVRDAEDTLTRLMHGNQPNWVLFERTIGRLVRELRATRTGVRIFGEMVDLLARRNDFYSAERLEEFWNRLAQRERYSLLCGYSAEHFGNPRDADQLRQICELHAHVHTDTRDVLGSFLVRTHVTA